MDYYLAIKWNKVLIDATTEMNQETHHKGPHIVLFHLREMSIICRLVKSLSQTPETNEIVCINYISFFF